MLSGKVLGYWSGYIVNHIGFTEYFVLSAAAALPAIGLYFWLRPRVLARTGLRTRGRPLAAH